MQPLFWGGLIVLVLGVMSLFIPVPSSEHGGVRIGDVSIGVETQQSEKISPIVSAAMILAGAGMMIVAKRKAV